MSTEAGDTDGVLITLGWDDYQQHLLANRSGAAASLGEDEQPRGQRSGAGPQQKLCVDCEKSQSVVRGRVGSDGSASAKLLYSWANAR